MAWSCYWESVAEVPKGTKTNEQKRKAHRNPGNQSCCRGAASGRFPARLYEAQNNDMSKWINLCPSTKYVNLASTSQMEARKVSWHMNASTCCDIDVPYIVSVWFDQVFVETTFSLDRRL